MAQEAGAIWIESQAGVALPEFAWQEVREPGAYVEVGSGDLYRVPAEALFRASSLVVLRESARASRLVQISKFPFISTLEARFIAREHNLRPNF